MILRHKSNFIELIEQIMKSKGPKTVVCETSQYLQVTKYYIVYTIYYILYSHITKSVCLILITKKDFINLMQLL